MTHALVDINEMMSDIISILHLSLNMPDMPKSDQISSPISSEDLCSSPKKRSKARYRLITRDNKVNFMMSPIIYGIGGEIEKLYACKSCLDTVTKLEYFISLNFKKISIEELDTIRKKFADEGYEEGIKFEEIKEKKAGVIERIFMKKPKKEAPKPIATLRDYLCHLNLLQKDVMQ